MSEARHVFAQGCHRALILEFAGQKTEPLVQGIFFDNDGTLALGPAARHQVGGQAHPHHEPRLQYDGAQLVGNAHPGLLEPEPRDGTQAHVDDAAQVEAHGRKNDLEPQAGDKGRGNSSRHRHQGRPSPHANHRGGPHADPGHAGPGAEGVGQKVQAGADPHDPERHVADGQFGAKKIRRDGAHGEREVSRQENAIKCPFHRQRSRGSARPPLDLLG